MTKFIAIRLLIGFLAVAIIYSVGFNLGDRFGSSDYHNSYMRRFQFELTQLRDLIESRDQLAALSRVDLIQQLAEKAGNPDRFAEALNDLNTIRQQPYRYPPESIAAKINEIIRDELVPRPYPFSLDDTLVGKLGANGMNVIDILERIGYEFGIFMPIDEFVTADENGRMVVSEKLSGRDLVSMVIEITASKPFWPVDGDSK